MKLNDALLQKNIQRVKQAGEDKIQKKLNLLKDMVLTNSVTRQQQSLTVAQRKAQAD